VHCPLWHESLRVQELPSSQGVPLALGGFVHSGPLVDWGMHSPARWHESMATHTCGVPGAQAPFWQESPTVQALPSEQEVPFGFNGCEHTPVAGLQVPGAWHSSAGQHSVGVPGTQLPAWQASPTVQALPSEQEVPFGFNGCVHAPVAGLQAPTSWHESRAVQTTLLTWWQVPSGLQPSTVHRLPSLHWTTPMQFPAPSQWSLPVHALPSLHDVAVDANACAQPLLALQESTVQGMPSSHEMAVWTHPLEVLHPSVVQTLLSLQSSAAWVQPVAGLQPSVVHALPSLHPMELCVQPTTAEQPSTVQAL